MRSWRVLSCEALASAEERDGECTERGPDEQGQGEADSLAGRGAARRGGCGRLVGQRLAASRIDSMGARWREDDEGRALAASDVALCWLNERGMDGAHARGASKTHASRVADRVWRFESNSRAGPMLMLGRGERRGQCSELGWRRKSAHDERTTRAVHGEDRVVLHLPHEVSMDRDELGLRHGRDLRRRALEQTKEVPFREHLEVVVAERDSRRGLVGHVRGGGDGQHRYEACQEPSEAASCGAPLAASRGDGLPQNGFRQ
jgi:hypothetical protein